MAIPTLTVTHAYGVGPNGSARAGLVTLTLSSAMRDAAGDLIVGPVEVPVPLVGGNLSVTLYCTDASGVLASAPLAYDVVEDVDGLGVLERRVKAPVASSPGPVDLYSLPRG